MTTTHQPSKWRPPACSSVFDYIKAERKYINESKQREQCKKQAWRSRLPSYRLCLYRDCPNPLLDKTNFDYASPEFSRLLKQWIGRSHSRKQFLIKGYADKASIVASSDWELAWRLLKCHPRCKAKEHQYPCGETDYCPACHWSRIGDYIYREYKGCFSKAGPWYAITIAFVRWGGRLTLVTRKDSKGNIKDSLKEEPYVDAPKVAGITGDDRGQITACGEAPFDWLASLRKRKRKSSSRLLAGALAGLDCYVSFFPTGAHAVGHSLLVHAHILANTSKPLDWPTCLRLYAKLRALASRMGIRLQPDMQIVPIPSQKELRAWLKYVVKPLVFESFYRDGVVACSDRPAVFNDTFDDVVFNALSLSYAHVTSPRRYGNMKSHVPKDGRQPSGDIGEYQYKKRIGKQKFGGYRLREREGPDPLTEEEKAKVRYEEARREQRRKQVDEWQEEKKKTRRGGRKPVAASYTAEEYIRRGNL